MTIEENFNTIDAEIEKTCVYAGVDKAHPKLVAVSKRQPIEKIVEALDFGHRVYGENRIQEAAERWPDLRANYNGVELHLIGSLQTNKVKDAVELFDIIQVVDRPKLARALSKEMKKQSKNIPLYIQVNTGEEPQKGGVLPADLPALVSLARDELSLNVVGLMAIPPATDEPAPHFAFLKALADQHKLEKLSMGMSGDYALAAAMGATDIRIGTAIFGQRAT